MKIESRWLVLLVAISLLLMLPVYTNAQEATGKIVGTVTDPSGALIPGAKVVVTDLTTKVSRDAVTDEDGNFQVLSLPIGTYQVTVEREGFKKAIGEEQKLLINQSLRFDFSLEVGSASETVTVAAQSGGVETINPTLGQSVTSRPIVNLPLNGRNVLQLALLQPGVTETNPGNTGAGGFSIAGSRNDSVTFLLDGGVNNNLLNNGVVFNPNPDTVAEFRILTSNYTAEYGRNGGGIISVVTKSGSNDFHGSVFDYVRNDRFNANSFFNNRDGIAREVLKRNQFGFTFGGPIILPRFGEGGASTYNGRDKAFFFVGYQGQRQVQNLTSPTTTTFSPAELRGDFSNSASRADVAAFLQANPFFQSNAALAAQGIIDPARIDPVAQNYIRAGLIPTSTAPGGRLVSQGSAKNDNDELTLKFDFNVRSADRFAVTLGASRNPTLSPFSGVNAPGFPVTTSFDRKYANLAYTMIFSPTTLNDFRFTAQRSGQLQNDPAADLPTATQLGIPGIRSDAPNGPPNLSFGSGLNIGFNINGPANLINNTFNFTDTFSMVRGKHTLKFGGNYSAYQNNTAYAFFVNGQYYFFGSYATGDGFADFLLGAPDFYLQFGDAPSDIRSKSVYGFAQDEWRVRPNLTLTLGVRYEYNQPKYDTQGRSFSLNPGQRSTRFPNAPVGLAFPGDAGAPRGSNHSDFNDFAPRIGFAYDPFKDGKTSIRGGFGVFYDILKGEDNLQFNGQPPFFGFADLDFEDATANRDPNSGFNLLSNPFVTGGFPNPFPSRPPASNIDITGTFGPFAGGGVFFVDPNIRTPYNYQYNLSIQRELMRNLVAEASYVGSTSRGLTALVDANPFILGTSNRVLNTAPGNTGSSFSYVNEFRNAADARYDSMQLSLQRAVAETGFLGKTYFTASYTWSHSIDDASGFRNRNSKVPAYNYSQFRADSDYDVRQRFSFSGGWDVPFERLLPSLPERLTKGFSIYPIVTYRTGFPLDVFAGSAFTDSRTAAGPSGAGDRGLTRANFTGNGQITYFDPRQVQSLTNSSGITRSGNFYFNPGLFTTTGFPTSAEAIANPALRTYGTVPRNSLRGPSRTNFDLAMSKITPLIGERLSLELRAEAFNVFNTAQFSDPVTNISSPNFGRITSTAAPRIMQFAAKFIF